ncbi:MAG: hypothetical protein IKP53_04255 [Candidatus Methanomethylophilaceae archaeon]|jgi:uncharacterized membrane protein YdjX (TVP38/TMEM64 family)|nr:hypothetical protein [Candidatus Methanomethylophilaceae archaeon]MBR6037946.1 hypothetical protein [Candidatus Methanomethylophilaceae archaeon]MBR7006697.1 hypothetical protein [Candidatus Methanomethylophilaceae archaeon]
MNISEFIYSYLGDYGDAGVLLCVFLIFLIDAIVFPALPEIFFILGYDYNPTPVFGVLLVLTAVAAELTGVFSLYYVAKHVRIPKKLTRIVDRYVNFLLVSDERVMLLNRIAPMIPFAGAFIALVDSWNPRKCALYIVIGCVLKYGVIIMASSFFYAYFSSDAALKVTLAFVIAVIGISLAASYIRKKKTGLDT